MKFLSEGNAARVQHRPLTSIWCQGLKLDGTTPLLPLYASMAWAGTTLPYLSMLENYACPIKDEVPMFCKKQHCSLQQNCS